MWQFNLVICCIWFVFANRVSFWQARTSLPTVWMKVSDNFKFWRGIVRYNFKFEILKGIVANNFFLVHTEKTLCTSMTTLFSDAKIVHGSEERPGSMVATKWKIQDRHECGGVIWVPRGQQHLLVWLPSECLFSQLIRALLNLVCFKWCAFIDRIELMRHYSISGQIFAMKWRTLKNPTAHVGGATSHFAQLLSATKKRYVWQKSNNLHPNVMLSLLMISKKVCQSESYGDAGIWSSHPGLDWWLEVTPTNIQVNCTYNPLLYVTAILCTMRLRANFCFFHTIR